MKKYLFILLSIIVISCSLNDGKKTIDKKNEFGGKTIEYQNIDNKKYDKMIIYFDNSQKKKKIVFVWKKIEENINIIKENLYLNNKEIVEIREKEFSDESLFGVKKYIEYYNEDGKKYKNETIYNDTYSRSDKVNKIISYYDDVIIYKTFYFIENSIFDKVDIYYVCDNTEDQKKEKEIFYYNDDYSKENNINKMIKYYNKKEEIIKTEKYFKDKLLETINE